MTVYFGTYTKRHSKGIYAADFHAETGHVSQLRLIAQEPNPTYLAFDKQERLYCVGAKDGLGGIAAYDHHFQVLNHVVSEGAPLCYVAVDPSRKLVYGANYHKGQVLSYRQKSDGTLELADTVQHHGSGPHENQTSSHVHFADLTPDHFLVTCDLGTDTVISYQISDQGKLTELARYQTAPGAGPRHLVFHPHAKMAYLICELNATIEVLIYDGWGQFEHLQTISTLPKDYHGFNATAAIRISQDGRFVYASNRGHDSIAIYQTSTDGLLHLVDIVDSKGKTPRDFTLSPDQNYLLVVHQDSDNLSIFKRNQETGKLTLLSHDFQVPEAVCILFSETSNQSIV